MRLRDEAAARSVINRSILCKGIYELWGSGSSYDELHKEVQRRTSSEWAKYKGCSFKFDLDTYQGKRSPSEQRKIIESFTYLGFAGQIKMRGAEQEFSIFEDHDWGNFTPRKVYLGRWLGGSGREAINTYSLKKRNYISTTSMDSELALLTANITLAGPNKIFYDPFVGTGSFPIACSHFGAITLGSDLDGRSIRGTKDKNVVSNFRQYSLSARYLDGFVSDLTHSPLRTARLLDGIICDPPYGVREGLKVLGSKDGSEVEAIFVDGQAAHL